MGDLEKEKALWICLIIGEVLCAFCLIMIFISITRSNFTINELNILLCVIISGFCLALTVKNYGSTKEAKMIPSDSRKNIAITREDSGKANELANILVARLKEAEEIKNEVNSQLDAQKETSDLMVIRVSIMYMIEELRLDASADINERINVVSDAVKKLSKKTRQNSIIQLNQELTLVKKEVEKYRERAVRLPEGDERISRLTAADRYDTMLKETVAYCNKLLKK